MKRYTDDIKDSEETAKDAAKIIAHHVSDGADGDVYDIGTCDGFEKVFEIALDDASTKGLNESLISLPPKFPIQLIDGLLTLSCEEVVTMLFGPDSPFVKEFHETDMKHEQLKEDVWGLDEGCLTL